MKFIFNYVKKHWMLALFGMILKIVGSFGELMIPYVMEHLIDEVVPTKEYKQVIF